MDCAYNDLLNLHNATISKINKLQKRDEAKSRIESKILIVFTMVILISCILFAVSFPSIMEKSFGIDQKYREANTDVIITPTGECYHTSDCRLNHGDEIHSTLLEAKELGYRECEGCHVTLYLSHAYEIGGVIFVFFTTVFLSRIIADKIDQKRTKRQLAINKLKKETKEKISGIVKNNSINSICNIPSDVYFSSDGLPYSRKENYFKYRNANGSVYHDNEFCRGNHLYKVHIFYLDGISKCYHCGKDIPDVSEWYEKYRKYIEILNYYRIRNNYKLKDKNFDLRTSRFNSTR